MVNVMGGCAVRPLLRTQEVEISPPPALVAAAVAVDRPRQEASHQVEEVAAAEAELRPAKVRRRAAVAVLVEEGSEEVGAALVEVELLPVVTLAPELPHQVARNLSRGLLLYLHQERGIGFLGHPL